MIIFLYTEQEGLGQINCVYEELQALVSKLICEFRQKSPNYIPEKYIIIEFQKWPLYGKSLDQKKNIKHFKAAWSSTLFLVQGPVLSSVTRQ